jgi:hypothetical protein
MAWKLITPAHPPLPTISKRAFQKVGSLTANRASGQITPRTSQYSRRVSVAATIFVDSILTSAPKEVWARVSHFSVGAAETEPVSSKQATAALFIIVLSYAKPKPEAGVRR